MSVEAAGAAAGAGSAVAGPAEAGSADSAEATGSPTGEREAAVSHARSASGPASQTHDTTRRMFFLTLETSPAIVVQRP
jgi:hypothetical protein